MDETEDSRFHSSGVFRAAEQLKALGHPTRLRILLYARDTDVRALDLYHRMGYQSRSELTAHLAQLRLLGLVDSRRDGKNVFYRATDVGRELASVTINLLGVAG